MIFLYTDGVAEASNSDGELFGAERLLAALNATDASTPEEVLRNVDKAVGDFVGDAPQFDDITMMGLYYSGPNTSR